MSFIFPWIIPRICCLVQGFRALSATPVQLAGQSHRSGLMQRLWESCGSCFQRRKQNRNGEVGGSVIMPGRDIERSRSSYDGSRDDELAEEEGGDTVEVPKWEEVRTLDQISKPKPVRIHLRRPSSMGLGYTVGLVYDVRMKTHFNVEQPSHPEDPKRISAILESLQAAGIVDKCEFVAAREATTSELSCVHNNKHIDNMRLVSNRARDRSSRISLAKKHDSIYFNEGSTSSALLAAGSCAELSLRIARGELGAGAAVVRPPGHHAEADRPMGFCLFNNVAIAAHNLVHCQPALGIKKVLIVDWDVHHGNGTQHMFWKDPFVLYFSIHRYEDAKFYPKSEDGDSDKIGEGAGRGFNVNVPWQRGGYGDLDYLTVFDYVLMPIAQQFNPDMVFISAGFDSALGDPLGQCAITPAGYFQMTQRLMTLASGRLVLALEGGYNLEATAASYLACMKALLGESCEDKVKVALRSSTWSLIKDVRKKLLPYWSSLSQYLADQPPEHFEVAEDEGRDSAYQDSVSVSEEDSDDEYDITDRERMAEQFGAGLQEDENPGDLLSQLRTQEARLSSVQSSDVQGLVGSMSGLAVRGNGQNTDIVPYQAEPVFNWEELLDETSKHYRDSRVLETN